MNPQYPNDYYDEEDPFVEKRLSVLRKEMYGHVITGMGLGVMLTVALASLVAWIMG